MKLLAPNISMSLKVTLYPFGPVVRDKDNSSIRNGSTDGNSISGMPAAKYGER